jgi:hypothetical protein
MDKMSKQEMSFRAMHSIGMILTTLCFAIAWSGDNLVVQVITTLALIGMIIMGSIHYVKYYEKAKDG